MAAFGPVSQLDRVADTACVAWGPWSKRIWTTEFVVKYLMLRQCRGFADYNDSILENLVSVAVNNTP